MTSLIPLLVAAGILLGANGIQTTLITIRADMEGMSPTLIGAMGTTFFAGYVLGTIAATRLIELVGHIRVFAALAAIASSCALLLVVWVDPYFWLFIRAVMGFCSSGLFTAVESWLSGVSTNANRGKVYSAYGMIDISAVTASQFALPVLGADGFLAFAAAAMLMSLSLVPIALSPTTQPEHQETVRLHIWDVWRISPLAFMACLTIGLTNSAFRTVGPLYAQQSGLSIHELALFMGLGIGGGAFLQIPFGWLSDHFNRRKVLMIATVGASIASLALSMAPVGNNTLIYAGVFMFGAFAMPLYSLAAAHANDFAKPGQYEAVSAGLLFTFAAGSMVGPLLGSYAMQLVGHQALFQYICVVHMLLLVWALVRSAVRPVVARDAKVRHAPNLRTTPSRARAVDPSAPQQASRGGATQA